MKRLFKNIFFFFAIMTAPTTMITSPFVNLRKLIPTAIFDIRYATTNNFTGKKLYSMPGAYAIEDAALALQRIAEKLAKMGLRFKFWDTYRPHAVQYILWDACSNKKYVMDPKKGSMHNRGCAVDLTLVDKNGNELPMGTDFDNFTKKAHANYPHLTAEEKANRALLIDIMATEKFEVLPHEWWHFNYIGWQKHPLYDISFEELETKE